MGQQDAQCKFILFMIDMNYETIEVSSTLGVIEAVTKLVHEHLLTEERLQCRSATDAGIPARSCFSGIMTGALRGSGTEKAVSGDCTRNTLMCNLLKLVNMLIQLPVSHPGGSGGGVGRVRSSRSVEEEAAATPESALTDTSKISQAFGQYFYAKYTTRN